MTKKMIVGNWKMNLNPSEASLLVHKLNEHIKPDTKVTVVFCPPFIDLWPISKEIDKAKFHLGSQNIHYLDEGAYTGEISPAMLKDLVGYAIIGHSERRINAGEDDKLIAKKVAAAVRNDIAPILCVGENLLEREHGASRRVVINQLEADLALLTAEDLKHLTVAYEPVWAIGTGKFATPDEVAPVITAIRQTIEELYGEEAGAHVAVLYGGSADADNSGTYLKMDGIDGLLVGGASLNYVDFAKIVKTAQDLP